jgi:hypothetical protein
VKLLKNSKEDKFPSHQRMMYLYNKYNLILSVFVLIPTTSAENQLTVPQSDDYKSPVYSMLKSNSDVSDTKSTTNSGNVLGVLECYGVNANQTPDFAKGAQIVVTQDGTETRTVKTGMSDNSNTEITEA